VEAAVLVVAVAVEPVVAKSLSQPRWPSLDSVHWGLLTALDAKARLNSTLAK